MVHNSNSNKQTKSASSTVWCGVLSDRQFACSAAAQHCVGSSTKQQTNKANTQQAIIIIIIDRYRYWSTTPRSHIPYVHTVPFSLLFYDLLPRPHTLILPFCCFVSFLFFLFVRFAHTNTHTHTRDFRTISIDRLHDRQHTHDNTHTTRRTSQ